MRDLGYKPIDLYIITSIKSEALLQDYSAGLCAPLPVGDLCTLHLYFTFLFELSDI